jgi:hypothetical protein
VKLSVENPVLLREMRQAVRLTRTPVILSIVTIITGLLVCAIGGVASTEAPPAEVGTILYQAFFSLAFAVVSWIGPGVAALTIVGERAGRTWEPLVLTGLSPQAVARGKFLASMSYLGLYLATLAPVGALPFLFGGVTATEVLFGYALLAVFAVLAVGFGLAVSSGAATPAMALLVTLPLSVAGSLTTYFGLGVGGSVLAHELWSSVPSGSPVWLPTAYARADWGVAYATYLVALPLGVAAVAAGFFREVTVANLSDPSADRSTGLKRWFVAACLVSTLLGSIPPWLSSGKSWPAPMLAEGVVALLATFALFVLSSDPPGPSRRVLAQWQKAGAGALGRFLGPGLARTAVLLVAATVASELVLMAVASMTAATTVSGRHEGSAAVLGAYASCFFIFLAGFATFARSLPGSRLPPRAVLALALFAAVAGPLFVLAIAGLTTSWVDRSFWIAAPSPLYVFAMIETLESSLPKPRVLLAGSTAMAGWAVLGAVLGAIGQRRLERHRTATQEAWQNLEARLRAEDEAARAMPPAA